MSEESKEPEMTKEQGHALFHILMAIRVLRELCRTALKDETTVIGLIHGAQEILGDVLDFVNVPGVKELLEADHIAYVRRVQDHGEDDVATYRYVRLFCESAEDGDISAEEFLVNVSETLADWMKERRLAKEAAQTAAAALAGAVAIVEKNEEK